MVDPLDWSPDFLCFLSCFSSSPSLVCVCVYISRQISLTSSSNSWFFFNFFLSEFLLPRVLSCSDCAFFIPRHYFPMGAMFCSLSKDIDYGFFDFMSCSLHNLQSLSVHISSGKKWRKADLRCHWSLAVFLHVRVDQQKVGQWLLVPGFDMSTWWATF